MSLFPPVQREWRAAAAQACGAVLGPPGLRRLAAFGIALWLALSGAAMAEELKLGILHVNDTHGHLLPFHRLREDGWGGFARLSLALERQRADTGYYWLTLHAGDAFQAAPLTAQLSKYLDATRMNAVGLGALWGAPLSNTLAGSVDLECMNAMGFDAMCLGNHEFDFGYELLRERLAGAKFPILSANVLDRETGAPLALPYVILHRGSYGIGVIGLTTESLVAETSPQIAQRVLVNRALPAAEKLAQYLRGAGCSVVIVLSHEGIEQDLELARQISDVDVVVGGHSHTFLAQPLLVTSADGRPVIVTQDGCYGQNLGVLKLTFTRADPAERFCLAQHTAQFVALKPSEPEDARIEALLDGFERSFRAEAAQAVIAAVQDPPAGAAQLKAATLASLVGNALRKALGEAQSCLARAHRAYLQ
jgi:2',3'-cyclic-nucleotide 2'-phosphodiesterase (5'-nucleotidase family)